MPQAAYMRIYSTSSLGGSQYDITLVNGVGVSTGYTLTKLNLGMPKVNAGWFNETIYDDVIDEYTFNIKGSSALDTLSKQNDLMEILALSQIARISNFSPVVIQLKIVDTLGSTYRLVAVVLDADFVTYEVPDDFSMRALDSNYVIGIRIKIKRRGYWLQPGQLITSSVSSNFVDTTFNFVDITYANLPNIAPVDFDINLVAGTGNNPIRNNGFIIATANNTRIVFTTLVLATATDYTAVGDAGSPSDGGGSILRFTPSLANTDRISGNISGIAFGGTMLLFAKVRNNSATTNFTIKAQLVSNGVVVAQTDVRGIEANANSVRPYVLPLGLLVAPSSAGGILRIVMQANAASGTCDIDSIHIVYNVAATDLMVVEFSAFNASATTPTNITLRHNLDTDYQSTVYGNTNIVFDNFVYGKPYMLMTKAQGAATTQTRVYLQILATGGPTNNTWRLLTGTARFNFNARAMPLFVVPE